MASEACLKILSEDKMRTMMFLNLMRIRCGSVHEDLRHVEMLRHRRGFEVDVLNRPPDLKRRHNLFYQRT